mgnify:CR=1 FL=1
MGMGRQQLAVKEAYMTGQEFASYVETQCGNSGKQYQVYMNLKPNDSWCAALISTCAQRLNISSTLIPKATRCAQIRDLADSNSTLHEWIDQGSVKKPKPGDIACIRWDSSSNTCNCVGVVTSYNSNAETVDIAIGDFGSTGSKNSKVRLVTYSDSLSCIQGYIRPDWSKA